jgi:hypothetical protein
MTAKPPAAHPPGKILGSISGVIRKGDGTYSIQGWACSSWDPKPIAVHLYLNGPAGQSNSVLVKQYLANLASGSVIAKACSTTGSSHRFDIPLSADIIKKQGGHSIFLHGISKIGKSNLLLNQSGKFLVPKNLAP